jgi:probable rRNA maturation factor
MRLKLDVQYATQAPDVPGKAALTQWVRAALTGAPASAPASAEVTVRVVDEPESAALNERYRRKQSATNVLSFPYDEPPVVDGRLSGDLVICAPVVQREARAQGKPETAHWAHMVVHGIMHLRGYDHIDEQEAAIMEGLEVEVLHKLGFPNPYSND